MVYFTTANRARPVLIDDEDWDKVKGFTWSAVNQHGMYVYCSSAKLMLHRLIMDAPKGFSVDHINGDTFDNRKTNLRICLNKDNVKNSKIPCTNTSGFKGVCWDKSHKKWLAHMKVNQKTIYIGRYNTPEEAHEAYCVAGRKYFGEFFRAR